MIVEGLVGAGIGYVMGKGASKKKTTAKRTTKAKPKAKAKSTARRKPATKKKATARRK